jgi:hypothetical protein
MKYDPQDKLPKASFILIKMYYDEQSWLKTPEGEKQWSGT